MDGPRKNNKNDKEKCKSVKKIFKNFPTNCQVKRNYNSKNMGLKKDLLRV